MCKNLIRMILFCGLVGVALCGLAASSAESVQVLMPYVLVGRVVDYDNCAYDASSGITLYVRKADGTVLVKSPVFTPGGISAWNFRLDVPMASKAVDGHATKGEQLTLTAVFSDGMVYSGLLTAEESTVGSAGSYRILRLKSPTHRTSRLIRAKRLGRTA